MKPHQALIAESVAKDLERAMSGQNPLFQKGDQIHLWSLDLSVQEQWTVDPQAGQEAPHRARIAAALNRFEPPGRSAPVARPLIQALERFGPWERGPIHVILYSDGTDPVLSRDAEKALRLFNHHYRSDDRWKNLFLIHFGPREAAEEARNLIASLRGRMVAAGYLPEISVMALIPATKSEPVISLSPSAIQFSSPALPEIVRVVPLEIQLARAQEGLWIDLELLTTNLASGMSIVATPERLATTGKQSISFLLKNALPGHYAAKVRLSAAVPIAPREIPVDIEILPSLPERIGVQFFPEQARVIELPFSSQWKRLPNTGISLFYADPLKQTLVTLERNPVPGLEIRLAPENMPSKPIASGVSYPLAELGRLAGFEVRAVSSELIGQELQLHLNLSLVSGQNVAMEGRKKGTLALRFVTGAEVEILTKEIDLGVVPRGQSSHRRSLPIRVAGDPRNATLRAVVEGLNGVATEPSEIQLASGSHQQELLLTGLDGLPPGPFAGAVLLDPSQSHIELASGSSVILIKGTIEPERPAAATPAPEARESAKEDLEFRFEGALAAGEPLFLRARFKEGGASSISANLFRPDSNQAQPIELRDSGAADDGDDVKGDGVYSGQFNQTQKPGIYRAEITAKKSSGLLLTLNRHVPILLEVPEKELEGRLAHRRGNELIEVVLNVVSHATNSMEFQLESAATNAPMTVITPIRALQPGNNPIKLMVALDEKAGPGTHELLFHLRTEAVAGFPARIPLKCTIEVLSAAQYFLRLAAFSVALAVVAALLIISPWKKKTPLHRRRLLVEPVEEKIGERS